MPPGFCTSAGRTSPPYSIQWSNSVKALRLPPPQSFAPSALTVASKPTAAGSILPSGAPSDGSLNPPAPGEFLIETPRLKNLASPRKQMPLAISNRDKMRCLRPESICGMGTFKLRNRAQSRPRRDSVWTHIHELPDLLSPALCYSSRVTREARRSRRALLGFRATAPAPPRFERAAFPFSSRFRCVQIRAYPCPQGQRRSECASLHRPRISASTR